jgi:hypothetical protein
MGYRRLSTNSMSHFSQSQSPLSASFLPSMHSVNSSTPLALLRFFSSKPFGHARVSREAHHVTLTIWTTSIPTHFVGIYTVRFTRQSESGRNPICLQADVHFSRSKSKPGYIIMSYQRNADVLGSAWLVSSQVSLLHLIHSLPRNSDLTLTFFLL